MANVLDPVKFFTRFCAQNEVKEESSSNFAGYQNILKLKKDTSYTLRLLWLPAAEGYDREYPMINQYVHRVWDDTVTSHKDVKVICPTTQYDMGESRDAFSTCPVCALTSKLYKEGFEQNIKSSADLYRKFKRTLQGYVPVYVVSGPEEDMHQVKILQYSILFKKFFDSKIFGINSKRADDGQDANDEENVGIEAFMYFDPKNETVITNGYNFIVNVETKKVPLEGRTVEMPEYKFDFSRRMSNITEFGDEEVTYDYFLKLSEKLGYDRMFYKKSDIAELEAFKARFMEVAPAVGKPDAEEAEEVVIPVRKVASAAPVKKAVEEPVEEVKASVKSSDDDIDIDELLKDI